MSYVLEQFLLGRPINYDLQIAELILHPERFLSQWGNGFGIFAELPGGKGA